MTNTVQNTGGTGDKHSNVFLFFGIALVVLGVLAIGSSVIITMGTVIIFGALLVAAGVAELVHACKAWHSKRVALSVLSGIIYLIAGGLTICNPIAGAVSFTLIISSFLIIAGILRCAYAVTHRDQPIWGWFLFGGILNLALGGIIASGWPVSGLWVIGLFVGVEMVTHGISWIAFASALKRLEKVST